MSRGRATRVLLPALAALVVLAFAASAQADYEQVGLFAKGEGGEPSAQMNNATSMAVNTTGAGGVEAGSVYVGAGIYNHRVLRYGPSGEFKEAWGWGTIESGPDQTSGFERCRPANGDVCTSTNSPAGEEVGRVNPVGIAVDQSTGYVYVLNQLQDIKIHNLIEVFSADGSEVIARFGDAPGEGDTIETAPEKINGAVSIAVSESGSVYVGASYESAYKKDRVMCFRPETPGDYEHYVYCGRSQDIERDEYTPSLAVDNAGHLYVSGYGLENIKEFSLAEPTNPTLLCTYVTHAQGNGMTVDPMTGEVFYSVYSASKRGIHRLEACDPETHQFHEAQAAAKLLPPTAGIRALTFNPTHFWGANRPPGALYAASKEKVSFEGTEYKGLGYIFAPAAVLSPTVVSESVSNTRTTSAVLRAEINPNGFGTHYVFQYLSEAEYEANEPGERFAGAMEAPPGGGEIGGGSIGEAVVSISGLEPDTAYRYRAIATSECNGAGGEPCVAEGEALRFSTYPLFPPGLPDHRVYELVSPAQKHGGEVIPAEPLVGSCGNNCKPSTFGNGAFPMQSTPGGEALTYVGQPFNPFEGAINYDSYIARRTPSGWQSTALIPALPPDGVKQLAFDSPLGQGVLSVEAFGSERAGLEIQNTSDPSSTTPLIGETKYRSGAGFSLSYGGHSTDFTSQFFAANDSLSEATPFAPEPPDPGASKKDLYEWRDGQLSVLNVLPGNETVTAGAKFASLSPDTHAVSEDGSSVFFEDETGNLYARESGEATRLINDSGHFLSASPDGSEVLLDEGCLYAVEAGTCTDLTEGHGGFKGLVGQSRDLSRIYFVDGEALAADAEAGTCTQAPGGSPQAKEEQEGKVPAGFGCNFYLYEAGAPLRFIATVPAREGAGGAAAGALNDWGSNPAARTAEASPDGRFLAFAANTSLTGYDNVGPCEQELNAENEYETVPAPCVEAFLYDSETGRLTCASCNPTGEAPLGQTTLRRIGGAPEGLPQPRYLTDEGRLYFDTQDSLVARDTNEGVEDVYEYSPQGAGAEGTCEREAGCTRLISAGTEAVDSNLIAVDETGKNVFFDTRDRLALKDKDELLDIYDAREGGGIAAESEIARAECQGENCQAPVSPPNDPTPGSSTFEGAGNVKEPSAAKKHKKAKKKHKRHSKKKHAKKHKKQAKKKARKAKKARTAKRNHGGAK